MLHDDGGDSPAGYNHSMKFGNQNFQHLNENSEEGHNLQKRFAEEYDVNLQHDYNSQYQEDGMNPNEDVNFDREGVKMSSRNLNHEFNKTADRNVSVGGNDNYLAK
jgi:replication initiation and membrane attachment protein DnaB